MLTCKFRKMIPMAILALSTLTAHASGFGAGNGGDGVISGRNVYLFDFAESGIEEDPYFKNVAEINPVILAQLEQKFDRAVFPVDLLAAKITEMTETSKIQAFYLLSALKMLEWRIVNYDIINIQDEDSVVDLGQLNLVQLAVRRQGTISINSQYWNRGRGPKLDNKNKAGLMIHEAVYAMMPLKTGSAADAEAQRLCMPYLAPPTLPGPDTPTPEDLNYAHRECMRAATTNGIQSSSDARNYVANLFSPGGLSRPHLRQSLDPSVIDESSAYLDTLPFNFESESPVTVEWIRLFFSSREYTNVFVNDQAIYKDGYPSGHSISGSFYSDSNNRIKILPTGNIYHDCRPISYTRRVEFTTGTLYRGTLTLSVAFDDPTNRRQIQLLRHQSGMEFGAYRHFTTPEACEQIVREFFHLTATP